MLFDHKAIRLKMENNHKTGKYPNIWKFKKSCEQYMVSKKKS